MGADFYVAVHASNWPTAQQLQRCFEQRDLPVKLSVPAASSWEQPLGSQTLIEGMLLVTHNDEPVELEVCFTTLSQTAAYAYRLDRPPDRRTAEGEFYELTHDEAFKPIDINESLAERGVTDVRFDHGDHVLTLTFRSNVKEWKAGFLLMAALIQCNHGYGFNGQLDRHGTEEYARDLIEAAFDDSWVSD